MMPFKWWFHHPSFFRDVYRSHIANPRSNVSTFHQTRYPKSQLEKHPEWFILRCSWQGSCEMRQTNRNFNPQPSNLQFTAGGFKHVVLGKLQRPNRRLVTLNSGVVWEYVWNLLRFRKYINLFRLVCYCSNPLSIYIIIIVHRCCSFCTTSIMFYYHHFYVYIILLFSIIPLCSNPFLHVVLELVLGT